MAYHLYGIGHGTGHLGKISKSGWHLVYGDGKIFLAPDDYHAYQLGKYATASGYSACYEGFITSKTGMTGQNATIDVIGKARTMILNDSGHWLAGNHRPPFTSCCGSCALGCFGNNTGTNEIAMQAGFYAMIPRYRFTLPAGQAATKAEIAFKGYSDYMIECNKVGSSSWSNAAFDMKDFRANKSVSGSSHTMYNASSYWDTQCTDILIAHASPNPDELTIKNAFYSDYWHGTKYSSFYQYSRVLAGKESTVGTSKNMAYYLKGNNHITYNGTFCGAIGTNAFPGGGSENYTNAYPFCDANDGTKTYANSRTGQIGGEFFAGSAGYIYKKIGGHFYTETRLPSAASSVASWLVQPTIPLTSWQLNALNTNGFIWVMVSNPCPWFCTTDVPPLLGASRQIFLEDVKLKVELG